MTDSAKPRNYRHWSPQEDQIIRDAAAGHGMAGNDGWQKLALNFPDRSWVACRQRWLNLRRMDSGVPVRSRRKRDRVVNGRIDRQWENNQGPYQTPRDLPRPRSLTAFICGDPLPGRSALDRRSA